MVNSCSSFNNFIIHSIKINHTSHLIGLLGLALYDHHFRGNATTFDSNKIQELNHSYLLICVVIWRLLDPKNEELFDADKITFLLKKISRFRWNNTAICKWEIHRPRRRKLLRIQHPAYSASIHTDARIRFYTFSSVLRVFSNHWRLRFWVEWECCLLYPFVEDVLSDATFRVRSFGFRERTASPCIASPRQYIDWNSYFHIHY